MFSILKNNPRFLRFWLSGWISEIADWLRNMTLMYVVMDLSGNSAAAVSISLFCEFAPVFLLGFLIGVFADRWDKKRTLMAAFLIRALIMGCVVLAIYEHSLPMIYACAIGSAVGTLLFRSSQSAFTMQFVPIEDRGLATSMRQMASSAMAVVGPAIATFFYAVLGAGVTIGITAVLFFAVLPLLASIRVENTAISLKESGRGLRSIVADFRSGFYYAWNHRTVRPILLANLLFGINAGVVNVLMIFVLTEFYKLPKETFAITAPFEGVAMLICSILLARTKFRHENMVAYSVIAIGFGTAEVVFIPNIIIGMIGVVIVVAGVVAYNNSTSTLMQTTTAFEYQGRLNMITQTAWMAPMVIIMLTAGWLLHSLFSVHGIVLATGALIAVCGVWLYAIYQRQVSLVL